MQQNSSIASTFFRKVRAFQLRSIGFTGKEARNWVAEIDADRDKNVLNLLSTSRIHRWGYTTDVARNFKIDASSRNSHVSQRDYRFVQPLNGKYAKWVRDRVSTLTVFKPYKKYFDEVHYHLIQRDNTLLIIPLSETARRFPPTVSGIREFLKNISCLRLLDADWNSDRAIFLDCQKNYFLLDSDQYSTEQFFSYLLDLTTERSLVLAEKHNPDIYLNTLSAQDDASFTVVMSNRTGANPQIAEAYAHLSDARNLAYVSQIEPSSGAFSGFRTLENNLEEVMQHPDTALELSGTIPNWNEVKDLLIQLCKFAPQLEFLAFHLTTLQSGPRITKVSAVPEYSKYYPFSQETVALINAKVELKKQETYRPVIRTKKWFRNAKLKLRKIFASALYPKSLVPYQSVRWLGDIKRDFFQRNGLSVSEKLWAYRKGFLSYRLLQYGISKHNWKHYISDLEYRWLRHINKKYKYWLEDKISIKYVASEFSEDLPKYYFYTSLQGTQNHVVPLMDCPEGFDASLDDILRLARYKGLLALKPDEGSHGSGFFKLSYENNNYSLNDRPVTEDQVRKVLANPHNQYIVTEYIRLHPELARIYSKSVNTIRIIVFKKDGVNPQIGNAYLRIGSSKSGYVDNTSAGGILAEIDPLTGSFGNAQYLENGRISACKNHPDTGIRIAGVIPNWEYAKTRVLEIAAALPQLEYLGFDIAITQEGIKIPEINRFPDYPRIEKLTPESIDYLLYKLRMKKQSLGYDVKPPRRLISLPTR